MIYADTPNALHTTATPGTTGACPACAGSVIAKCGQLVIWHWAHASGHDCDTWSEPIGHWHLAWQELAPRHCREVVIGAHRADLRSPGGVVVELQHSSIPVAQIRERERFYGRRMAWIWDVADAYNAGRLALRRRQDAYVTFRWKQPRKAIGTCANVSYLDLGDGFMVRLGRLHVDRPCGGWGHLVSVESVQTWIQSWHLEASA